MSKDAVELKTERLLLRPFQLKDVDDVFEYARDPEWARYLPHLRLPYTRRDAEEFVADRVLDRSETHSLWAIVLEEKVVGGIGLPIDERRRIAELGYSLARQHWGEGIMPEAARAMVDWGFEEHRLAKVYSFSDSRNTRSLRVMEKLGMTREGVLRSHGVTRDGRADFEYYGLLREEWEASK